MSLLAAILFGTYSVANAGVVEVGDHGAIADGETINTSAIQKAIDACAEAGGGRVHFPAGDYVSGTLFLKDGVYLDLDQGATLLGSTNLEDYPITHCELPSYTDKYVVRALIWGEGLKNVGLVGRGTIDGQGEAFLGNHPPEEELAKIVEGWDPNRYTPKSVYINRPYIIRLISCRDILVEGLTLKNSPMWMQQYLNCDFVTLRGLNVYNHCNKNNDMIDIDGCRDVIISDCYGDSDDDALTLKSTVQYPTENVTVTNCVLSSHCNALKMGTESSGGFKNIAISNCVIRPSRDEKAMGGRDEGLAGIALEIVDGGVMDGVTISNISIVGETVPIFIRLGNRGRQVTPVSEKPSTGLLRNVILSNIVATQTGNIGCSITGQPDHPVENVTLSNIRLEFAGGMDYEKTDREVPELPAQYPESVMFGHLPAYGFYCRHVDGLTFENLQVEYLAPDTRPALVCEDVQNLTVSDLQSEA
ncbi:MAG: glycoside hydrolase, partial [Candidatus Omnitrophica bacterium]|nr:glycoside hydrolase [Candidatus Omnitrophota bacterium]